MTIGNEDFKDETKPHFRGYFVFLSCSVCAPLKDEATHHSFGAVLMAYALQW